MNPFAALEQRVNAATTRRLANAVATVDDGEPFGVVFRTMDETPLGIVESTSPSCDLELSNAPGIQQESVITINEVAFVVVGYEPDGTGFATLRLREV